MPTLNVLFWRTYRAIALQIDKPIARFVYLLRMNFSWSVIVCFELGLQ
jgi:hypothetical protein